jgi:hypothetical protein
MHPDLDSWLPDPQVRTLHRRSAKADADRLWDAAEAVRLRDTPALGRAVRWRIPDTPPDRSYRDLFREYPFTTLAEGTRWSVSGLCGRIWTFSRDYPRIDGLEEFLAWKEPDTARVVLAHWIEGEGSGQNALISETRIKPVDGQARFRIRALWTLVGHLEPLIEREALRVPVERAEEA